MAAKRRWTVHPTSDSADLIHVEAESIAIDANGALWFHNQSEHAGPVGVVNPRNWIACLESVKPGSDSA